ncbi:MAG: MnmC family methyltransferase [Cyanobacteria bacterium]|nr:MnmC family methyltransferase [Cyanobacteriota bacterium]
MTLNACGPELGLRRTGDGSFSLYSPEFGEGFHCADGALAEARRVFVAPAQLERFSPGSRLRVLEVAVGTGTNTASLLQASRERQLELDWWGLELDPLPLQLALADAGFRHQWPEPVLVQLQGLTSSERLLWGEARSRLPELQSRLGGDCDLVLLDAFSPRHCPQLWSVEFLADLAALLAPEGRLLTYCSAAAVRRTLGLSHLQLAAICSPVSNSPASSGPATSGTAASGTATSSPAASGPATSTGATTDGLSAIEPMAWSAGTVASPTALPMAGVLRPLSPMELEHLACRAGEPYRDPSRQGTAAEILARRQQEQRLSTAEASRQWQRRWGLARRHHQHQTSAELGPDPAPPDRAERAR